MSYTIRAARIENLKSIREADLADLDTLVLIGGDNGVGKTNVLAILGGAVGFPWPDDLLRDGETRGEANVELVDGDETFNVKIVVTEKGQRLKITKLVDGEEMEIPKPRAWLKKRLSGKHFDVLAAIDDFNTPRGERAVLERMRDAAGLDFADLDGEAEELREERKIAKGDLARAEAARDAIHEDPDCPDCVDVLDLIAKRDAIRAENNTLDGKQNEMERRATEAGQLKRKLQAEIAALVKQAEAAFEDEKISASQAVSYAEQPRASTEELGAQINGAEAINARVRKQAERHNHVNGVGIIGDTIAACDARLTGLADRKREILATADFGVAGLTLSDDLETILWEGEPLRRLSDGNKIGVFALLHAAQNPEIGVMFSTRASLLDDDHLRLCDDIAKQMGMQFILEVVGSRQGAIVIEATADGSVVQEPQ